MMKAHSAGCGREGTIEDAEIKERCGRAEKADENGDGKLTEEEVGMKYYGAPKNTGRGVFVSIAVGVLGASVNTSVSGDDRSWSFRADGKFSGDMTGPPTRCGINISTPVYHDGHVFAATAYGAGGGLVRLVKKENGEFAAEEVWFSKSMENHHGGVILHDGAFFGANGGNGGGYIACLDFKTGEVLWNERDSDKRRVTKGSVAFADDRIYYRTEEGPIVLIEPSRKEYLERGRFNQPERTDKPAWAHPVIANGKLYIRDQDTLFCYDVKAK
jgi:outer membrane protein assembly factor BamB